MIVQNTLIPLAGTAQKLRHTSLLPGQFPGLTGQMTGRLAALVTQTPSIAVPLCAIPHLSRPEIG